MFLYNTHDVFLRFSEIFEINYSQLIQYEILEELVTYITQEFSQPGGTALQPAKTVLVWQLLCGGLDLLVGGQFLLGMGVCTT